MLIEPYSETNPVQGAFPTDESFPLSRKRASVSGGFLARWRRLAVVLSILMMFVTFSTTLTQPKPAEAALLIPIATFLILLAAAGGMVADSDTLAEWGKSLKEFIEWLDKYTGILKLWKALKSLFDTKSDDLQSTFVGKGQSEVTAKQAAADVNARLKDVSSNNATLDAKDKGLARLAAKFSTPEASNQLLCNMIIVRQLGVALEPFKDLIKDFIKHSLMMAWMGPNAVGRGPAFNKQMWDMTCGNWLNGTAPKTGRSDMGMPTECIPSGSNTDTAGGYGFEGASARPLSWNTPLTLPYMTPSSASTSKSGSTTSSGSTSIMTITLDADAPDIGAQQRWLAAVYNAMREAGGRPVYPSEELQTTDAGYQAANTYKRCASKQTEFADTSAERIAYLTRPNCKSTDTAGYCYLGRFACGAFIAGGVLPPTSLDNCRYGLSYFEALSMIDKVCLSSQYVMDRLNAGEKHGEVSASVDFCGSIHAELGKLQALLDMRQTYAMKTANTIDSCWGDYNKQYHIAELELQKRYLAQKDKKGKDEAAKQAYRRAVKVREPVAAAPKQKTLPQTQGTTPAADQEMR